MSTTNTYTDALNRMNIQSDVALRATVLRATPVAAMNVLYAFVAEAEHGKPLDAEAQRVLDICGRNLGEKYSDRIERIAESNDPVAINVMLALTVAHAQLRTTVQPSVLRRQARVLNRLALAALDDQVTGGSMSVAAFDCQADAAVVARILSTVVDGPDPVVAGSTVTWSCPADLDAATLRADLDEYVGPLSSGWADEILKSASLA